MLRFSVLSNAFRTFLDVEIYKHHNCLVKKDKRRTSSSWASLPRRSRSFHSFPLLIRPRAHVFDAFLYFSFIRVRSLGSSNFLSTSVLRRACGTRSSIVYPFNLRILYGKFVYQMVRSSLPRGGGTKWTGSGTLVKVWCCFYSVDHMVYFGTLSKVWRKRV